MALLLTSTIALSLSCRTPGRVPSGAHRDAIACDCRAISKTRVRDCRSAAEPWSGASQAGMPRRACGTCGTDPTGHPARRHQPNPCTAAILSSGSRRPGTRTVAPGQPGGRAAPPAPNRRTPGARNLLTNRLVSRQPSVSVRPLLRYPRRRSLDALP